MSAPPALRETPPAPTLHYAFEAGGWMRFDRLMEHLAGVFALIVLIGGALLVVAPFVPALLWGAVLAFSTWGPYQRITAALGGRRVLATLFMVLLILVVLLGPIFIAGFTFATHIDELIALLQHRFSRGMPPLPEWLLRLPFIGTRAEQLWIDIATQNPEIVARMSQFGKVIAATGLAAAFAVMHGLVLLALSVLFAASFYLGGESAAAGLQAGMRRIAGARGAYLLELVGNTVRGAVYGIIGTSLVQAALCGIGYWIVGLPSPVLPILPGGPLVIIVPGAIWLVQNGATGWAIFLVVWALLAGIVTDNVLKPILIGKTSQVPVILIMVGVLGGAIMFGLLGVFIGPTLLAVAHAVLRDWAKGEAIAEEKTIVPAEDAPSSS
jgi:predicted PurR-regulated permease PerM